MPLSSFKLTVAMCFCVVDKVCWSTLCGGGVKNALKLFYMVK